MRIPGYSTSKKSRKFLKSVYQEMLATRRDASILVYVFYYGYFIRAISEVFKFFQEPGLQDDSFPARLLKSIQLCIHGAFILIVLSLTLTFRHEANRWSHKQLAVQLVPFLMTEIFCDFFLSFDSIILPTQLRRFRYLIILGTIAGKKTPIGWKTIVKIMFTLVFTCVNYRLIYSNERSNSILKTYRSQVKDIYEAIISTVAFKYIIQYLESHSKRDAKKFTFLQDQAKEMMQKNDVKSALIEGKIISKEIEGLFNLLREHILAFQKDANLNHGNRQLFDKLFESFHDLSYLLSNLLDLQKISKYNPTLNPSVDLTTLCYSLVNQMNNCCGGAIIIEETGFDRRLSNVCVDPELISKSLFHLLSNSIKYASKPDKFIRLIIENRLIRSKSKCNPLHKILEEGNDKPIHHSVDDIREYRKRQEDLKRQTSVSISRLLASTGKLYNLSDSSINLKYTKSIDGNDDDKRETGSTLLLLRGSPTNLTPIDEKTDFKLTTTNALASFNTGQVTEIPESCFEVEYTFRVEDEGEGIDEKVWRSLEHYGSPFVYREIMHYRIAGQAGTGLGLAITRKMVEALGSKLKLVSQSGKGTQASFKVILETS